MKFWMTHVCELCLYKIPNKFIAYFRVMEQQHAYTNIQTFTFILFLGTIFMLKRQEPISLHTTYLHPVDFRLTFLLKVEVV